MAVDGRVARILTSLAAGGPAASWPEQLVEDCLTSLGVSGVGLAVMSSPAGGAPVAGGVLAATTGPAVAMEELQFSSGEGPCMDASASGRPVLVADLVGEAGGRWPVFGPGAAAAGVAAAFTFPLRVGAIAIGVLDLYRDTTGPLSPAQVTEALAYADAAVAVLLHLQDSTTGEGPLATTPGRAVVHQAVGMISVQLASSLAEALVRLRAHAYAADRPVVDVATDVVRRRLRFDHSEVGTTSTADSDGPHHPPSTGDQEDQLP